jgi:hypothetical protein
VDELDAPPVVLAPAMVPFEKLLIRDYVCENVLAVERSVMREMREMW